MITGKRRCPAPRGKAKDRVKANQTEVLLWRVNHHTTLKN